MDSSVMTSMRVSSHRQLGGGFVTRRDKSDRATAEQVLDPRTRMVGAALSCRDGGVCGLRWLWALQCSMLGPALLSGRGRALAALGEHHAIAARRLNPQTHMSGHCWLPLGVSGACGVGPRAECTRQP